MPTPYRQTFVVTGSGDFPLDMLRYDGCHPATQEDVLNVGGREKRNVTLERMVTDRHNEPTAARWASFVWSVDRDSVRTTKIT